MQEVPLRALNLDARWPKLAKLQADLAEFQQRQQKAAAKVATLTAQLPQARGMDIAAEAKAARETKEPPEPIHEPKAQRELDRAVRDRDVSAQVVQGLHEELGAFMAEHQPAIFADVVGAQNKLAAEVAEHARAALGAYSRHEDLSYVVRKLRPAAPTPENLPVQRLTQVVAGIQTSRSSGPARGHVEEILSYLASLADTVERGKGAA